MYVIEISNHTTQTLLFKRNGTLHGDILKLITLYTNEHVKPFGNHR